MAYDFSDLTPAQTRVLQNGGWHVSDASTFIQPSKRTVIKLIARGLPEDTSGHSMQQWPCPTLETRWTRGRRHG